MRPGSDPELVVKNATLWVLGCFLSAFLDKICNTFCQEGVIRICITVVLYWIAACEVSSACCHLTDESGGGALSNPEAELPLLPLPQLSFRAGGDEDRILVYQGLVKNLETHRRAFVQMRLSFFIILCNCLTSTRCVIERSKNSQLGVAEGRGSWSVSVKSGALSEVTLQLWVRVRKQPESHVSLCVSRGALQTLRKKCAATITQLCDFRKIYSPLFLLFLALPFLCVLMCHCLWWGFLSPFDRPK